jgi:hypothetical protein
MDVYVGPPDVDAIETPFIAATDDQIVYFAVLASVQGQMESRGWYIMSRKSLPQETLYLQSTSAISWTEKSVTEVKRKIRGLDIFS